MKFILAKKIGMTQIFSDKGAVIPVTRVQAGPCSIVQIQAIKKDNKEMSSVQIGFGIKKEWRLSKPVLGHLKKIGPVEYIKSFIVEDKVSAEVGDKISVNTFSAGDKVAVIGTSKGKGFAGVVKRHHFGGGPASHGHKDNLRMPGSIGAGGVQRVFKGMRMAGRMGGDRVTVKNLEIVKIDEATGELFIKGAVPGARNGFLIISGPGELQVLKSAPVLNDQVKDDVQEVVVTQQDDSATESIISSENSKTDSPEEVKSEENKV